MVWQRHRRDGFLAEVGGRVRALREAKGLSRQALADHSGVSPRYLAQLESGGANLSIERLGDLAAALEVELPALVDPRPQPSGRAAARGQEATALRTTIDALLDGRDLGELREVRRWLEARFAFATALRRARRRDRARRRPDPGRDLRAPRRELLPPPRARDLDGAPR